MFISRVRWSLLLLFGIALYMRIPTSVFAQGATTEISFYYPTAVGGPLTKIMDGFAADFSKANPDVKVTPVYSGGYPDVYKAIQTQLSGGQKSADCAILLSTDLYSLVDNDYIVPLDSFIKGSPDGDKFINDFFPGFMRNSQASGQTWGIPFQRSTPVLYYNKDMFKAAGIDSSSAPKTWQDMLADAQKLNKPGQTWGIEIPSDGLPYWLFQGFAISNGQNVVGDSPKQVFFNTPSTVEALQYVVDLSAKYNVMPKGVIVWGNTPTDFTSGKVAMIYHTTGSLTSILQNAKFDVGVGFLPQGKAGYGAPTGGGNMYILKSAPAENQSACWRWMQYLSSPDIQSQWTVATGYIAVRKSAWDTDTLKKLVADHPQYAVARDQLEFTAKELSTHQSGDVQAILGKAVQSAITGEKTPQQALDDAQKAADNLLAQYPDEAAATPEATASK